MLISMVIFLINPILITYVFYRMWINHDVFSLAFGILIVSIYLIFNIFLETTITTKEKFKLSAFAPSMYVLFYVIIIIEYIAIIKSFISLFLNRKSVGGTNVWEHVKRAK